MHQRAHGLGPQDDLVARLDVLEPRGQRPVRHLDRVELELLVPGRRGDGIGAQQRLAVVAHEPDHHELARAEAQRARPRHPEREQPVGPVADARSRSARRAGRWRCGLVHGGLLGHLVPRAALPLACVRVMPRCEAAALIEVNGRRRKALAGAPGSRAPASRRGRATAARAGAGRGRCVDLDLVEARAARHRVLVGEDVARGAQPAGEARLPQVAGVGEAAPVVEGREARCGSGRDAAPASPHRGARGSSGGADLDPVARPRPGPISASGRDGARQVVGARSRGR